MAEICSICGLPRDICVCGEISKEQQRIRVRLETRKFRRAVTIIDGINDKDTDLEGLAKKLKGFCACGGTAKNSQVILQGDHRQKVYSYTFRWGTRQKTSNFNDLKTVNDSCTRNEKAWACFKTYAKYWEN